MQYCATPSSPQGGPRDETPPTVTKTIPSNATVNFTAQTVVIQFDENITLNNPNQKIWITPLMAEIPKFSVKKDEITIEFQEPLQPLTTYNIAFGDAISDVNEGNTLSNFSYTFSTGTYIDSASIRGTVSATDIPERTFAMLYDSISTTIVKYQKPDYIYALGKEGNFSFQNLAPRPFSVFVLTDKNNNYIYDLPNEKIGFLENPILASDSSAPLVIQLFDEERNNEKISTFNAVAPDNAVSITMDYAENDYSRALTMTDTLGGLPIYSKHAKGNEFTFIFPDSGNTTYKVYWEDSIIDTLSINMQRNRHYNFLADIEYINKTSFLNNHPVYTTLDTVKFIIPNAININTDKIILKDSTNTAQGILIESSNDTLEFLGAFKDKTWYKVILQDSAIRHLDWMYHYALADTLYFYTLDKKNLGAITFVLPDDSNCYVFQLYQGKNMINSTYIDIYNKRLTKNQLIPDNYSYTLGWDKNCDGRMNGGSLETLQLPEPEYKCAEIIVVKPNWEQDIIVKPTWNNYLLNTTNTAKNINTNPRR